jgi:hypothetical protein
MSDVGHFDVEAREEHPVALFFLEWLKQSAREKTRASGATSAALSLN